MKLGDAFDKVAAAIAENSSRIIDDTICAAVVEGYRGRIWFRVTGDVISDAMGVEILRRRVDEPCPWPECSGMYFDLDDAGYAKLAALECPKCGFRGWYAGENADVYCDCFHAIAARRRDGGS